MPSLHKKRKSIKRISVKKRLEKRPEIHLNSDDPIELLKLPIRLESALRAKKILTIEKFLKYKRKRLLKIKNLGPSSVNYLIQFKRKITINEVMDKKLGTGSVQNPESNTQENIKIGIFEKIDRSLHFTRNHSLDVLGLPIRAQNSLKKANIHRLGELYDFPEDKFKKLDNIGPKTIKYINYLKSKLIFGANVNSNESENVLANESLIQNLIERAGNSRSIVIIQKRYGLKTGEKETLDEIGKSYGVTRERVRQIQSKALKRIQHPSTISRKPIIEIVEKLLYGNDAVISDEEADILIPKIFKNLTFDGSSLLDLITDLKWIQKHEIGDVLFYSPKYRSFKLATVMENIYKLMKKTPYPVSVDEIIEQINFNAVIPNKKINLKLFIKRCCQKDPRIEEKTTDKYGLLVDSRRTQNLWVPLMIEVLEEAQTPLHFTELADKVNAKLVTSGHRLEQRRAHALVIYNNNFAHSGIRGTYGLTKWGLRKDSTIEIATELISNAGFPLHFDQIYDYISRYKDSPKGNIRSVLDLSGKFVNIGNGFYDIKRV